MSNIIHNLRLKNRLHKRLTFENHARALGFIPPGVTPNSKQETGVPSTPAADATTVAAAHTSQSPFVSAGSDLSSSISILASPDAATHATTTPPAAAATQPATAEEVTVKDAATTSTTPTTQVAAPTPSVTLATSKVPTTPPAAATTHAAANTVAANTVNPVNSSPSDVQVRVQAERPPWNPGSLCRLVYRHPHQQRLQPLPKLVHCASF